MTEPPLFGPSIGSGPSPQGDTPAGGVPPGPDDQAGYRPMSPLGDPASPAGGVPPPGPGAPFTPPPETGPGGWTAPGPTPPAPSGPPPGPTPTGTPGWASSPAYSPVPTGTLKSGGSRGTGIAVILVAVVVAAAGAIAALVVMGSGGPNASPAGGGSAAATPPGVLVFTDDFHDPASGWSTETLPSGTTYAYTSKGFEVHAVGALHHIAPAPHGRERQRIAVSTTATQSSPAPDSAGFGVTCDRGTDAEEIRYEFIAFADGTWSIERLDGPLSTTGNAPDSLKQGSLTAKPGAVPMTVEGTCITPADGLTTQLALSVNGAKVTELSDTATALPGAGWYAELVVVSDEPATTVTVTKFEVRTLP